MQVRYAVYVAQSGLPGEAVVGLSAEEGEIGASKSPWRWEMKVEESGEAGVETHE